MNRLDKIISLKHLFLGLLATIGCLSSGFAQVIPANQSDTTLVFRYVNVVIESKSFCEEGKHQILIDLSTLDSQDYPNKLILKGMRYDEGENEAVYFRDRPIDSAEIMGDKPIYLTTPGYYWLVYVDEGRLINYSSEQINIELCALFKLDDQFKAGLGRYYKPAFSQNIEKIDLIIFDGQGNEVFVTKDPNFKWDGMHFKSGEPCPAGSYFYHCDVFEKNNPRKAKRNLTGIIELTY